MNRSSRKGKRKRYRDGSVATHPSGRRTADPQQGAALLETDKSGAT